MASSSITNILRYSCQENKACILSKEYGQRMAASARILNANRTDNSKVQEDDNGFISGDHISTSGSSTAFHFTDLGKSVPPLLTQSYTLAWE